MEVIIDNTRRCGFSSQFLLLGPILEFGYHESARNVLIGIYLAYNNTMREIIVKIPVEVDEELLEKLKKDIDVVVRLRVARELLLKEWDKRFAKSELTEEECLELGKEVSRASLKAWKEKGKI
jgi:hypothetical protein